jgi:carbonic anhydrase/acetyltransferase-like protein (isoleucine patch superfamily)
MRATILDGAIIGTESLVAAGSVVTPGTNIPPGSMVMGAPAKVKRELTDEERRGLWHWAEKYVVVAKAHAARL